MYEYRCVILKVIDGDTVDADVDLGFDVHMKMRFRLADIDAPEMRTEEGKIVRDWLVRTLQVGSTCVVRTNKDRREKYGRYLGSFFLIHDNNRIDDMSVNEFMVKHGFAKRWGIK